MEVNGPYTIEDMEYVRDATRPGQGVLVLMAAGGEKFAAPMSVNEITAKLEKLLRDVEGL